MSDSRPALKWSLLDRLALAIAPSWGLSRIRARAAAEAIVRHYDAAAAGRRTAGWSRFATDANAANQSSLAILRDLSRDLRRNSSWARRAIDVISTNTVGHGIRARAVGDLSDEATELWDSWTSKTACDYDGRLDFYGLQDLVMQSIAESGEALVIRERGRSSDGLPVPLRIRVVEPDYLAVQLDGQSSAQGGVIVQGIELDGQGRRVAYWLYDEHPGASFRTALSPSQFVTKRVPAEDVIHIYRVERPGQMRGVPWLAAAIARIHGLDELDDAVLVQQKVAACFGAFVRDLDGAAPAIGEQSTSDPLLEHLEPGLISYLTPGQDVSFARPPEAVGQEDLRASQLRAIAAALGITYEDLTLDYSRVNFSSARIGRQAHHKSVTKWRWFMIIPQLCEGVWNWCMDLAQGLNGWPERPRAIWLPPPMASLEPEKEGLAWTRAIRSGVKTLPQVLRELGGDPVAHLEEIAATNARLDELGIVIDSDPRRTSAQGQHQDEFGIPLDSAENE